MEIFQYFLSFVRYVISNGQDLLVGGVIVVGVVIALMGIVKNLKPIKSIKNKTARKILLAWLSIAVTLGVTAASVFLNEFKTEHFWGICVLNCVATILVYWCYEYTAVRNFVELLGTKVIAKILKKKPKTVSEAKDLLDEINADVQSSLLNSAESESRYRDDDLKNL